MPRIRGICLTLCIGAGLVWLSCDVSDPDHPPVVNPDKANANSMVTAEKIVGSADKRTSLWDIVPAGPGEYYFEGPYNSSTGVGALGVGNSPQWFVSTVYSPGQIFSLAASSPVSRGLLQIGTRDTDGDGNAEQSCVSVYNLQGGLASQLFYASDSSDIRFNSIDALSDSLFLVAGSERSNSGKYPLLATIVLTPTGALEKRQQIMISAMTKRNFNIIAVDKSSILPTQVSFFALVPVSGSTEGATEIQKITVGLPSLSPRTSDWVTPLVTNSGAKAAWAAMRTYSNAIYLVGNVEDPSKTPAPSGGGYWTSGLVACFNLEGEKLWEKDVSVSKHADTFSDLVAGAERLYAVGHAAAYKDVDSGHSLGYALATEIDLATGDVIRSMTFGWDFDYSGVNGATISGSTISCAGFAHEETGETFVGWYFEIDVSGGNLEACRQLPRAINLPDAGDAGIIDKNDSDIAPEQDRD